MNIKIIVATHKKYQMPNDDMYLPVHVGAANKDNIGYIRDDSGDNISTKNANYCELTGLYWGWKNLDCDYIGLVHYRRHFMSSRKKKNKFDKIITSDEVYKLLKDNKVLLPKKRNYIIETNKSQYLHAHHSEGLENTENAIKKIYPEYIPYWNTMLKKRSGHRFNMFIMEKKCADEYCEWLFNILFEVEKNTNISNWSKSEQRIYGYISERLLDVWIYRNNIKYKDIPYMFMEHQNWLKKGMNFIKRKFSRKKVE